MTEVIQLKKKLWLLCLWCDLTMLSTKTWKPMPRAIWSPIQTQMKTQIWNPMQPNVQPT